MSENNNTQDQASLLRERMNDNHDEPNTSVDLLALPPRSKVHKTKDEKKKTKVKLKYPLVRFLALLFILLPIAILGYTYHQNNQLPASNTLIKNKTESSYKEEISLSKKEEKVDDNQNISHSEENTDDETASKERTENAHTSITSNQEDTNSSTATQIEKTDYDVVFHTVKENETLYSISQHYYNSRSGEELIKEWNNLTSNEVVNGKVLKIPLMPNK
jgi:LysM repeat protein